jgi:hypothetical protein
MHQLIEYVGMDIEKRNEQIRVDRAQGMTVFQLMEKYNLGESTVYNITNDRVIPTTPEEVPPIVDDLYIATDIPGRTYMKKIEEQNRLLARKYAAMTNLAQEYKYEAEKYAEWLRRLARNN